MRRKVGGGVAAAIALLAALPAGATAAQTVIPSTVGATIAVPAGKARSLTLTCPNTAVALHAAPVRMPSGVRVVSSVPGDQARRWTLRFASVARKKRKVTAVLRCVRLDLPAAVTGVTVRVNTTSLPGLRVRAGATRQIALSCPSGYVPTGQGVGASTRGLTLAAAVPNGSGWVFRVKNRGKSAARAGLRIRCIQRVVAGRRHGARAALAFRVKRVAYQFPVRSGKNRSVHGSCARGRFSLGTGVSLDRGDDISLLTAFPSGSRGGLWFFRNSGPPEPVTSYLLCLSRSSRFG
jgi:hypothetical protein